MSSARKSHSNRHSRIDRAAIMAAAGISAALGFTVTADAASPGTTSTMAPSAMQPMSPTAIRMTSAGVTMHSDRLAAALKADKAGTIKALQARFPGLTASQVSVGANNAVTFKISKAAFTAGHRIGDDRADNGICNGGACSSPLLPGEEGYTP